MANQLLTLHLLYLAARVNDNALSFLNVNKVDFFLLVRCLYKKQNKVWITWRFLFSYATRYLTSERGERVRFRVEHEKKNSISPRAHVLFSTPHPGRAGAKTS